MNLDIKEDDLKRIANIAIHHLDFIKRQEGKEFPPSDKRIREIALSIAASFKTEIRIVK